MATAARDIVSVENLTNELTRRILAIDIAKRDRFAPGESLPSVRDLANSIGCSTTTVQRAYAEVEHRGLIVNRGVMGRYVRKDVDAQRLTVAITKLRETCTELRTYGYTIEDVSNALKHALGELDDQS